MKTQDDYQKKYSYGDTRLYLAATICLTLIGLAIYTLMIGYYRPFVLIGAFAFVSVYRIYSAFNQYRKVVLFGDRIQIVGGRKEDFTEIYFDNIENIGFLRTEVNGSYSFVLVPLMTRFEIEKLTIIPKHGERVMLPRLEANEMDEILEFVRPRINPDEPTQHFDTTEVNTNSFKGRYSQVKFDTGKTGFIVCIIISVFVFLIILLATILHIYAFTIFFLFVLIGSGYGIWSSYTDYKEILVYDDRMQIVDISRRLIREIYFSEIKNIGFLHGATHIYHAGDSDGERSENMVLLMYDGSREDLNDEISNIHQLCAIVEQKVNQ